jgi:hypothetical protein
VLKENDTSKLFRLVEIAEAAALARCAALEAATDHHDERLALEEALSTLKTVKKHRLKFG